MAAGTRADARWREPVAVALLVVGVLLASLSVPALWLDRTVMDTDRWVETVAPLAHEPAIQAFVARTVADAIKDRVDVGEVALGLLPSQLDGVVASIVARAEARVDELATQVVHSDEFVTAWVVMNRSAHRAFLSTVGGGPSEGFAGRGRGAIVLDTAPIVEAIRVAFERSALGDLSRYVPWDSLVSEAVVWESPLIAAFASVVAFSSRVSRLLPVMASASLAGALWLSSDRRRAFERMGVGFAGATLVTFLALAVGRVAFASAALAVADVDRAAADVFYATVVRSLVVTERAALAVGIAVATVAFLAGPSVAAVKVRATAGTLRSRLSAIARPQRAPR